MGTPAPGVTAMDDGQHYWTYWVHRVQELWREHEKLERRVDAIERQLNQGTAAEPLPRRSQPRQAPAPAPAPEPEMAEPSQAPAPAAEAAPPARAPDAAPGEAVLRGAALKEMELSACMALRELGGEASIHEINAQLAKSRSIKEDAKTTLMRLRGALQKGYVGMDPATKRFKLLKESFVVS